MDEHTPQAAPAPEAKAEDQPAAYDRREELDTPYVVLVGIIFAIVVFLVIFFLQGLFYRMQKEELAVKVTAEQPQEISDLRAQQQARLTTYAWVDRPKGVISIPIADAMQLELHKLQDAQHAPPAAAPPPGSGSK